MEVAQEGEEIEAVPSQRQYNGEENEKGFHKQQR